MRIDFREKFALPVAEIYGYFRTPADWARLYGLAGQVRELGDGWFAVPLHRFPFPLVARNTQTTANEHVHWTFRGFWKGEGDVRFEPRPGGVVVVGYEIISMRWLPGLTRLIEKAVLERRFRAIWELGWRRLRRGVAARADAPSRPVDR